MKHAVAALAFAACLIGTTAAPVLAEPLPGRLQFSAPSPIIQVDRRCGRGRHYVPAHRSHGHLVRGACVRDH